MKKYIIAGSLFILAFLVVSIAVPQVYFPHKIQYKNFTIHSTETIPSNIYTIVDSVTANLQSSPLYFDALDQSVFICNNQCLYTLYCYPARSTFGGNWELWGNIFLSHVNVKENSTFRQQDHKTRSLVNLLTHETVHTLLEKHLGFQRYTKVPRWKIEGYCDYVAQGGTLSFEEGIQDLCAEQNLQSYFPYQLAVRYLLEAKETTLDDFLNSEYHYDEIRNILKEKYCAH